ncbi:MAG: PHP domain-containing protein [Chloroflexi bacterium]|nr:PHP domain-containing protein [Chloroflexota bacterium]
MGQQGELKKIDLHVHTPGSGCYEDHVVPELNLRTSPEDLVSAARVAGLDAIAITDHNTVKGVAGIQATARGNGLVVWPGVEVTTRGGHLLAIFDTDMPLADLSAWLRTLGFKPEEEGDGYYQTELWLDEVAARVAEMGGLAIAAHVDRRPRGFAASEEALSVKVRIHNSPHLSALEITTPMDKAVWNQGKVPNYPKKYACIQGSDAHGRAEVGRRPVYVRTQRLTLEDLREVLADYEARLRFPQEMDSGAPDPRGGK